MLVILIINDLILNGNGQKLQKKSFLGPEVGTNRPEVARNGLEIGQKQTKMTENDLRHSNESRCNANFLQHFLRLKVAGNGPKMDCKWTKYRPQIEKRDDLLSSENAYVYIHTPNTYLHILL